MKRYLLFIFFMFPFFAKAQIDTSAVENALIESLVEEIAASSETEVDFGQLYDDLVYYSQNKLNLNSADAQDLANLHFLSEYQIEQLLHYRARHGQLISIYELQLIPGFSYKDIQMLLPFVKVAPVEKSEKLRIDKVLKYGRNTLITRDQFLLQQQAGFVESDGYLGDRQKLYARYKFTYRDRVSAGVTAEKDPGEEFFKGSQKYGFDFYSAHLQIDKVAGFERIVVGDFQGQFGQGLVLWSGMAMSKSSYVLNVAKKASYLRKYSSTDENRFFRGAGVVYKYKKLRFTAFASYKKIDATSSLTDTLDDEVLLVSSLQSTGYHRTEQELAKKHAIGETVIGGDVLYSGNNLNLGFTAIAYKYSAAIDSQTAPYNLYNFSGDRNFNAGINWLYIFHGINFFGESALSANGAPAVLGGFILPLAPQLQLAGLYRYYSPQYHGLYANGFSETSKTQNEQGVYIGLRFLPVRHWQFSFYVDNYSFPWMRFGIYEPKTNGTEYFAQASYEPLRNLSMYWRMKYETKPKNLPSDSSVVYLVGQYTKASFRYNVDIRVSSRISLKSRVETSMYRSSDKTEKGILLLQDLKYSFASVPLSLSARFALFDAPYNARIYAYENDVLYAFSVPAYMYQGFRTYLLVKYDLTKQLTLWLRLANTTYTDRDVISPGALTEINSPNKTEIKMQVRYKF